MLTSTYNEPLITSEWAVAIFKTGKIKSFDDVVVPNGNATPEVLEYIRPYVDCYKIDLKKVLTTNTTGILEEFLQLFSTP